MSKSRKSKNKVSLKGILNGQFLVDSNATSVWKFLVFGIFLAFAMISSAHWIDTKVVRIEKDKEKLDEVKARYALIQSKLIQMQLESELANQMERDSLISLEEHPIKIVVQ